MSDRPTRICTRWIHLPPGNRLTCDIGEPQAGRAALRMAPLDGDILSSSAKDDGVSMRVGEIPSNHVDFLCSHLAQRKRSPGNRLGSGGTHEDSRGESGDDGRPIFGVEGRLPYDGIARPLLNRMKLQMQ